MRRFIIDRARGSVLAQQFTAALTGHARQTGRSVVGWRNSKRGFAFVCLFFRLCVSFVCCVLFLLLLLSVQRGWSVVAPGCCCGRSRATSTTAPAAATAVAKRQSASTSKVLHVHTTHIHCSHDILPTNAAKKNNTTDKKPIRARRVVVTRREYASRSITRKHPPIIYPELMVLLQQSYGTRATAVAACFVARNGAYA